MYSCVTEKYSKLRPSEVDYIYKKNKIKSILLGGWLGEWMEKLFKETIQQPDWYASFKYPTAVEKINQQTSPLDSNTWLVHYSDSNFTTSPLHHFTISPLHHFTISSFHHFTTSPLHHFTISYFVRQNLICFPWNAKNVNASVGREKGKVHTTD